MKSGRFFDRARSQFFRILAAALIALPSPAPRAQEERNLLLWRVAIGDYVLSEAVEGEERNGVSFVDLAELAAALEEPPRAPQMVSISKLRDYFPAEFEADIRTQNLRVSGRGELGVELRLVSEYEARVYRRQTSPLPKIETPRRLFAPPFATFRHGISRDSDGRFVNRDSVRLFGDFLRGNGSFSVSESEGEYDAANWTWWRDPWRTRGNLDDDGRLRSAAVGRRFDIGEESSMDFEWQRREDGWGGALSANTTAIEDISLRGGWAFGEGDDSWRGGASWSLGNAGFNYDYYRYSGASGLASRDTAAVSFRAFSVSRQFSRYRTTPDQTDYRLRHSFRLGRVAVGWRARYGQREDIDEKEIAASARRSWRSDGGASYSARISHRREFTRETSDRAVLSFRRGFEQTDMGVQWTRHFDSQTDLFDFDFRRPIFNRRILFDSGISADNEIGLRSVRLGISYTFARDPRRGQWRADQGFASSGALSVCAQGGDKEAAEAAGIEQPQLRRDDIELEDDGCAFKPFIGGEVAMETKKWPPWVIAHPPRGWHVRTRPGAIARADFVIFIAGEIQGVVTKNGGARPGVEVRLIPAKSEDETAAEIGFERETQTTRTAFDGYYFFPDVAAGEYRIEVGTKSPHTVRVTAVGETQTVDIELKNGDNGDNGDNRE